MREQNEEKQKLSAREFFRVYLMKKVIIGAAAILLICIVVLGLRKVITSESQTTKIGFEDIGELATQSAYCTEVNVTEDARKFFGITIPFTQSKYIYSYDVEIKAGYDFTEIEWSENGKKIEVELPEAKILSNEIDMDSLKIYHEDESIYSQITLEENNEAMKELQQNAQESAIENGLLENARTNAETILTSFFANVYDLDEYEIVFTDK